MASQTQVIKVGILTVSDSCSIGKSVDKSGENLKSLVESGKFFRGSVVTKDIIPDDAKEIKAKLIHWTDHLKLDLILTTGGTGFSPRDVTPEATKAVLEKEALGMTVAMIKGSLDITPKAMLSRLVCGSRGTTLILNLPGSSKGSVECLEIASAGIPHAVDLLKDRLTDVQKTHRQMIKQCEISQQMDWQVKKRNTESNQEFPRSPLLDHTPPKVDCQEERMEENVCSSQTHSMFILIELLLRLVMPSIPPSSAAYRILQSLSSSLSSIRSVSSMQRSFDVCIIALRSMMEASGNETDSHLPNSTLVEPSFCQNTETSKVDEMDCISSPFSFPSLGFSEAKALSPCELKKLSRCIDKEAFPPNNDDPMHSRHDMLSLHSADSSSNFTSTEEIQSMKSSLCYSTSQRSSLARELKKKILNKLLLSNQFMPDHQLAHLTDNSTNSSVNLSNECKEKKSHSYAETPLSGPEVNRNVATLHTIQATRECLPLSCSNENSFPKSSQTKNTMKAQGNNLNVHYYKKLLMDCGWKKQMHGGNFSPHISDRSVDMKNGQLKHVPHQDHLKFVVSSILDTPSNGLEPSTPCSVNCKRARKVHPHVSQGYQLSTTMSPSYDSLDSHVAGSETQDKEAMFSNVHPNVARGLSCKEVTFSHNFHQDNATLSNNGSAEVIKAYGMASTFPYNNNPSGMKESRPDLQISSGPTTTETGTGHKRSLSNYDMETSSQISSINVRNGNMQQHTLCSGFKSAKIHRVRNRPHGELVYIPVGHAVTDFINEHSTLKGINLYKGKRDIKKSLVNLCRQEEIDNKAISWKRGKEILERNRLDDFFQLTDEGTREQTQVHYGKKRDQYVVNWYMWCPGHGNCKRKCGGVGHCVENCKGMLHKQDRHNCSLMVNLKLFLSDLDTWRIHITGSHLTIGHVASTGNFPSNIEDRISQTRKYEKSQITHGSNNTSDLTSASSLERSGALEATTSSLYISNNSSGYDNDIELATSKIPSKKRISKMLSNLKRRRKGKFSVSKSYLGHLKNLPSKVNTGSSAVSGSSDNSHCENQNKILQDDNCANVSTFCKPNDISKIEQNSVRKEYPVNKVLPLASFNSTSAIDTPSTVSHCIVSRASLPVHTVTNVSMPYSLSQDSDMNVQAISESVSWTRENVKGQTSAKLEGQVATMPNICASLASIEDHFQQPFLNTNTLCDFFHQASSDLPPHLEVEDIVDVMADSNWATTSNKQMIENPHSTPSPMGQSISHFHENPVEVRLNMTNRIPSSSLIPRQFPISESISSSKPFTPVMMDIHPTSHQLIYGNMTGLDYNSAQVDSSLLKEESFSQKANLATESLPSYQEARAALGQHNMSPKNSFL